MVASSETTNSQLLFGATGAWADRRWETVVELLERHLQSAPLQPWPLILLAASSTQLGRFERAYSYLEAIDPDTLSAWEQRPTYTVFHAYLLAQTKRMGEACELLTTADRELSSDGYCRWADDLIDRRNRATPPVHRIRLE